MFRSLIVTSVVGLLVLPALAQEKETPKPTPAPSGQQKQTPEGEQQVEKKEEGAPAKVELGKTLPKPVALKDIDGTNHDAANYLGQVVVVNFWSIKCPIMQGYEKRLTGITEEYGEKGVRFLMINSNEGNQEITDKDPAEGEKPYQKIRTYLAEKELPYTVLIDHGSEVARLFDAQTTPDIFVFDREGKLVYRGLIDDDPKNEKQDTRKNHLRTVLDELLAGEEVEPYATVPYGCTIKWGKPEAGKEERRPRGEGRRRGRGEGDR